MALAVPGTFNSKFKVCVRRNRTVKGQKPGGEGKKPDMQWQQGKPDREGKKPDSHDKRIKPDGDSERSQMAKEIIRF